MSSCPIISHISLPSPTSLLACPSARPPVSAFGSSSNPSSSSVSAHLLTTARTQPACAACAACGLARSARLTRPPAFSPARRSPSIKSPERGSCSGAPHPPCPPGTSKQGPILQQASAGPRTWGASAPSLLAPLSLPSASRSVAVIRSVRDQAGPTSRTARAATISYLLPVRVWSSDSHAALIPPVMATPSTGAIPPPKQIRFVNNQGQPPSKRRRVNAASVHHLLTAPSTPSAPLHCVICAPTRETLYHESDFDCD